MWEVIELFHGRLAIVVVGSVYLVAAADVGVFHSEAVGIDTVAINFCFGDVGEGSGL